MRVMGCRSYVMGGGTFLEFKKQFTKRFRLIFIATFNFEANTMDLMYSRAIKFRLGGVIGNVA